MEPGVVVIIDLVGSRQHADRAWVHRAFTSAMAQVNGRVAAVEPLAPTLGDEAQGRYGSVGAALHAALLLRLALPAGLDCRAGIGVGPVQLLGESAVGLLQDGPGWWAARDAINEAKAREVGRDRSLRTWYECADGLQAEAGVFPAAGLVNAVIVVRDQIVTAMNDRSRRLLAGLLAGRTQAELAAEEGVSASAVSQNLRRSGAYAVTHAHEELLRSC